MIYYNNKMEIQPEDMTLEQIKEQMASNSRLYYQKRRNDKEYMERKRINAIKQHRRKKLDKMVENGEIDLKDIDYDEKTKDENKNNLRPTKPRKYKGEPFQVITVQ